MGGLRELGEEGLLGRIFPLLPAGRGVVAGAGDDAAVLEMPGAEELLLFKTDSVVGGRHFDAGTPADMAGRKALARAVSDMAAMGGRPWQALVALALPEETAPEWVTGFYEGMRRLAEEFEVGVCGGELSATEGPVVATVALAGTARRGCVVRRGGGRPGDFLYVTGELGGSRAGHHLTFRPRVREALWLAEGGLAAAMMDLSDGLGADLPRLARASGCGFRVDCEALPCRAGCGPEAAIGDGEDFELLVAVRPERVAHLAGWGDAFPDVRLTRIGELVPAGEGGAFSVCGYDHFAQR